MKKKEWKGFILGFISAVLIFNLTMPALAATVKQITATYKNVQVVIDGKRVVPKDAYGKPIEPFISGGTTYLPIRGIASALGLDVEWDGKNNTVYLTSDQQGPVATPTPAPTNQPDGTVSYNITYQDCKLHQSQYSDNTYYSAIVEIRNTGTANLYLADAIFDFENRNGNLLATDNYISKANPVIAPGEKGYFFGSGSVTGKLTVNTDYVFKPKLSVVKSKLDIIRYSVFDVTMNEEDETTVSFIGKVTNNTDKDAILPNIKVVLYRADGTPILAEHRNISALKAGDTTSFDTHQIDLSKMGATCADVASYEIFSCQTQYQFD